MGSPFSGPTRQCLRGTALSSSVGGISAGDLAAQQFFDRWQGERVVLTGKADRGAAGTSTAGTTDAVHIVVRGFRQGEVDHVADGVDVNAAAGHVGGDQHTDFALAEAFEHLDALVLRHVARHLRGADAVAGQALLDAADFVLAVGEDHHPGPVVLGDQVVQQLVLVAAGHGIDVLLDGVAGDVFRFDLDDRRIDCPLLGQVHHIVGEGGGEQQGLPLALHRGLADDLAHLRDEAHVEHAVSFVEHHDLDHVQVHFAALVEVQQTPGGGDQNVAVARFQLLELLVEVHAADKAHDVELGVFGQGQGVVGDLHHQLTGWSDDQRARLAHVALFGRRRGEQLGDGGNQERGGLAGAGLGAADGVLAAQGMTEHLGLNRCAVGKAQVVDGMHQLGGQIEVVEAGLAFCRLDREVFQLPGIDRLGWALAARLVALGPEAARLLAGRWLVGVWFAAACCRNRGVGLAGSAVDCGGRLWRAGLAGIALAEHGLECLEHGDLDNWLRNIRSAV